MNMKQLFLAASVACLACTAPGRAMADVKAGVDAWEQGKYDAAVKQWRPAAAAGDADAQFNLGQAYKLGRGVPMDIKAATEWFRKRSEEHTSELQSLMRISYAVFCLKNKKTKQRQ